MLMNYRKTRDWLEGIGIVAVAASLIFVGLQVRQEKSIAIVETFSHRTELTISIVDLISANSDVWTAGLAGEELHPEDFTIFTSIYESLESFYMYRFARGIRLDADSPEKVAQKFAWVVYQYPSLRKIWINRVERVRVRKQAFNKSSGDFWMDAVIAQLEKLDSRQLPVLPQRLQSVW